MTTNGIFPFLVVVCLLHLVRQVTSVDMMYTNAIGWGYNSYGQLGRGYESFSEDANLALFPWSLDIHALDFSPTNGFSAIATGRDHVIAIEKITHRVYTWGSNQNRKLGLGIGVKSATINLGHRHLPSLTYFAEDMPATARLVAAASDFSVLVDLEGSLWVSSDSSPGIMVNKTNALPAFPSSPQETAKGLSCDGNICAVWTSSYIFCFQISSSITVNDLQCDFGSSIDIASVSVASNTTHYTFTMATTGNSASLYAYWSHNYDSTCVTDEWCLRKSFVDLAIEEVSMCSPSHFLARLSDGNVWERYQSASGPVEYLFRNLQLPLNAVSISCSYVHLYAVHRPLNGPDQLLSFAPSSTQFATIPNLLGRPHYGFGSDANTISNRNVPLRFSPGNSVVLANMSTSSTAVFALFDKQTSQPGSKTIHAISWGIGDVGTLMTRSSPSGALDPVPVSFPDTESPNDSKLCKISGGDLETILHCPTAFYRYGRITDPIWFENTAFVQPLINLKPDNSTFEVASAADGTLVLRSQRALYGLSIGNNLLNISNGVNWVDLNQDYHHLKCGPLTCGLLDAQNVLYLIEESTSNDFLRVVDPNPIPNGLLLNTTLTCLKPELFDIGNGFKVLVGYNASESNVPQVYIWSLPNTLSTRPIIVGNYIKVVAGRDHYLTLVDEAVEEATSIVSLVTRIMPLLGVIDIAAIGDTSFALADVPGSQVKGIYTWARSLVDPFYPSRGSSHDPNTAVLLSLPDPNMKPTSLCTACRGKAMFATIEPLTVTMSPSSLLSVPTSSSSVRTCFGSNLIGSCEASGSNTNTHLAFDQNSFSDRLWKDIVQSGDGPQSFGLSPAGSLYVWSTPPHLGNAPYASRSPPQDPLATPPLPWSAGQGIAGIPELMSTTLPLNVKLIAASTNLFYVLSDSPRELYVLSLAFGDTQSQLLNKDIAFLRTSPSHDGVLVAYTNATGFDVLNGTIPLSIPYDSPIIDAQLGKYCGAALMLNKTLIFQEGSSHQLFVTLGDVHSVATGNYHAVVLHENSTIKTLALSNQYYQAGVTTQITLQLLVTDLTMPSGYVPVQVAATAYTSFVRTREGKVIVWGLNSQIDWRSSQLGMFGYHHPRQLIPFGTVAPYPQPVRSITTRVNSVNFEFDTPVQVSCGPPPSGINQHFCSGGVWVVIGNLEITSGNLVVPSPLLILGNVTIPSSVTVTTPFSNSIITIDECVTFNGTLEITLTEEEAASIQTGKSIELLKASCGSINGELLAVTQKSCRRVSATKEVSQGNSGVLLVAVFSVSSSCTNSSRWWIILVSVLGGVVVLAAVIALLVTFTPLKAAVRPFTRRASKPEAA